MMDPAGVYMAGPMPPNPLLTPVTPENAAARAAEIENYRLSLIKQKEEIDAEKKKVSDVEKKAARDREIAEYRQAELISVFEFQRKTSSRRPPGMTVRDIFSRAEADGVAARAGRTPVLATGAIAGGAEEPANSRAGPSNTMATNGAPRPRATPPHKKEIPDGHYDTPVKNLVEAHKAFQSIKITGEGAEAYKVRRAVELLETAVEQ